MRPNLKLKRTLKRLKKLQAKLFTLSKKDDHLKNSYQSCQNLVINLETYQREWDRAPELKGDES